MSDAIFNTQALAQAAARLRQMKLSSAFDASNLDSRPNPIQDKYFQDINEYKIRLIRAGGQSGKTSSAAREVVWILEDSHPYWKRPKAWKNESLLIIVAGQDREMMEIEIWNRKILPLLTKPEEWRPVRSGNALKHVVNKKTGDMIVFISHADSSETNRKHMQGYVGHYVWMDELSDNLSIIEELQRRVVSKNGYFTLTFTPKGKSGDIRRWADGLEPPLGNVYRMGQLDNPLFAERKEEMMARVAMMPEGLRNTVLYGDWEIGDKAVYGFDKAAMVSRPPEDYSKAWRHVEGSDPAVSSKFGLVVLANEPCTDNWWVVKADYVHGIASPDDIVAEVIKRTEPYNITRRVVDSHESWYKGMASKMGLTYMQPYDKNNRKSELIKGLQLALSTGRVKIAPWCTDLIAELQAAQWADTEGKDKIVNSKSYHTSDALQYVVDCLPKPEDPITTRSWEEELRFGNKKRKELEQLKSKMKVGRKKWTFNNGSLTRLR